MSSIVQPPQHKHEELGQDKLGQDKLGQDKLGQDKLGQSERGRELAVLISLMVAIFCFSPLTGIDTGITGIMLLGLGVALGAVFLLAQYGFSSVWRRFLETGALMGLSQQFFLIGLCAIAFLAAPIFGLSAKPTMAPVAVSLFLGALIFGIGMQLANGCGSGVLFTFGGGSGRMIFALPAFIVGSVIGSLIVPTALGWGSIGSIAIAGDFNPFGRWLANLILVFGVSGILFWLAKKRGETLASQTVLASICIAFLCWAVFFVSGHPWGVTFGFTLWGAKIAQAAGMPMSDFAFWQWAGPEAALNHSVLANASSVLNIGMIIGAAMIASWSGGLRRQNYPPLKQIAAAIIGGLIMGIGARLSFGCNIGAFLAGIASGSLHGWIWFVMAMSGSWIGIRLRPYFGF